jgi:hypothetical protein
MTDWEAHHRALVRRLIQIANGSCSHCGNRSGLLPDADWRSIVREYDQLAWAHKKTIELFPDDNKYHKGYK